MRVASLLLVAALVLPARAQSGGTESPLMLGSGARELGMGRAVTAIAMGSEALFWNPAALADLSRGELSLFHSPLYADQVALSSVHLAYPTLDQGTFAVGLHSLGVGGLELRDERNALLGEFDERETHVLLGYGRRLRPAWSVGGALRIVQQRVQDASGMGVGVDVSARWRRPLQSHPGHELLAGGNLQNLFEPTIRLIEDDVHDPRRLRTGIGYRGQSATSSINWTLSADLEWVREAGAQFLAGAALGYGSVLQLRLGVEDGDPAFGFGIESRGIRFDYAMRTHDELERNDRFSLALQFGGDVFARRDQRRRAAEKQVEDLLSQRLRDREDAAVERDLEAAETAFDAGDFDAARRYYRRVLALRPEHEVAAQGVSDSQYRQSYQAAQQALDEGRFADAASSFMAVLVRWPEDQASTQGLAAARAALQRAEDREAQLSGLFRSAMDRFTRGDLAGAERDLRELLRMDPDHTLGAELLGRVESLASERSREHLRRAERLYEQRQFEAALAELARAEALRPGDRNWDALRRRWQAEEKRVQDLAELARREGAERERASAAASAARELDPDERVRLRKLFERGLNRFEAGDYQQAIENWQRIWNQAPEFESVGEYLVKAYLFEGIQLYSQGDYAAAIERCQRILDIDPQNPKARRYLARIREEQQEVDALGGGR